MCWQFHGIISCKSQATDKLLYVPTGLDWTVHKCAKPGHTSANPLSSRNLPLEFQWKIATWASERLSRMDPESSEKFRQIVEQKLVINSDQSLLEKYRVSVGVIYREDKYKDEAAAFAPSFLK